MLDEHRKRGFSIIQDVYAPGMSSMAAPVQRRGRTDHRRDRRCRAFVATDPSAHEQFGAGLLAAADELAVPAMPRRC